MNNTSTIHQTNIGNNIRRLRISKLISRKDLALLAGVDQLDVDSIENNIPLQMETKLKILRALYSKKRLL